MSERKRAQPFYGQIGAILLLEDAVGVTDVPKILELGKDMQPKQHTETTETLTGQKDGNFILERKFLARIMFSYSPKAIDRMMCLDTATAQVRSMLVFEKNQTKNNATKMMGVKEWNTKNMNTTVDAIGGVKVLL